MERPNVFVDFHHGSLLNSFIMLFEKRLDGKVYRPIGMEWAEKGYWKVYDHPATQQQFLAVGGATPDGSRPLNEVANMPEPGIYLCHDIEGDTTNRAITLEYFFKLRIDLVIASLPAHVEPFKKLAKEHWNKPKFIFQIGNSWTNEAASAPNIMASANIEGIPEDVNFISYHQEFDRTIFSPFSKIVLRDETTLQWPEKKIYSFVNCFNVAGHFADDWQLFQRVEEQMPDYLFRSFGGQCRDGSCDGSKMLADTIRDARFVWHTKNGGDGYGHIIHNVAACGKPLIVKKEYYKNKLADKLLIDGKTCIAIDGLNVNQIIEKIHYYSNPIYYGDMCQKVIENFSEVVDFDKEFAEIQKFLANLK